MNGYKTLSFKRLESDGKTHSKVTNVYSLTSKIDLMDKDWRVTKKLLVLRMDILSMFLRCSNVLDPLFTELGAIKILIIL